MSGTSILKVGDAPEFWVDIAELAPFKVKVRYLTPKAVRAISEQSTRPKLNKTTRQMEEVSDSDLYSKLMCRNMIIDWGGLTLEVLEKILPVDKGSAAEIAALEDGLPFSQEHLEVLTENTYSTSFMDQIIKVATDLNVAKEAERIRLGNS